MVRRSRLQLFLLAPVLAGLLLAAGCSRRSEPAGGSAATPQILRLGNSAEPEDLDPQNIQGVPELNISLALFDSLVEADPHDLHPVPGQAESWTISPDGLTYTFHLRAHLRWSNGEPLTADDFIQSYRRMLSPAFAAEYAYLLLFLCAGGEGI